MKNVFVALGSNLGNRRRNLQSAVELLQKEKIKIKRVSQIYETEPVGFKPQPMFLNMVVLTETKHSPEILLKLLNKIEAYLGRKRLKRNKNILKWTPRSIDLDILFYNNEIIKKKNLMIPHLRIAERRFVLVPMAEVAPRFYHPILKKNIKELLKESSDKSIVKPHGIFSRTFKVSSEESSGTAHCDFENDK